MKAVWPSHHFLRLRYNADLIFGVVARVIGAVTRRTFPLAHKEQVNYDVRGYWTENEEVKHEALNFLKCCQRECFRSVLKNTKVKQFQRVWDFEHHQKQTLRLYAMMPCNKPKIQEKYKTKHKRRTVGTIKGKIVFSLILETSAQNINTDRRKLRDHTSKGVLLPLSNKAQQLSQPITRNWDTAQTLPWALFHVIG